MHVLIPLSPYAPCTNLSSYTFNQEFFLVLLLPALRVPMICSFHPGLILFGPFLNTKDPGPQSLPGLFKAPEVRKQERFPLRRRAPPWSKDSSYIRISPKFASIGTFQIRCSLGGHIASHPWHKCQVSCQKSKGHTELAGRINPSYSSDDNEKHKDIFWAIAQAWSPFWLTARKGKLIRLEIREWSEIGELCEGLWQPWGPQSWEKRITSLNKMTFISLV